MAFIDYYKILGVDKTATKTDIKKAYRKLARKYHPDLNANDKDAELQFKKVNEANEVLSNDENRKKYDKYGENWQHGDAYDQAQKQQGQQRQSQQHYQRSSGSQGYNDSEYSDFFESMFGGGFENRGRTTKFRGQDFNAQLQLDLKDAYTTEKRVLTVNGKNIRLTIPAGITNGQIIRIKGKGGEGRNGGPHGDLLIEFIITNNTDFKRDGANLYKTVNLDLYKSVLGGDVTIDTFDGKVKLNLKPLTQNGTQVKLKGKGFPIYKKEGKFGDLYITYNIELPKKLSDKEKELFEELAKLQ